MFGDMVASEKHCSEGGGRKRIISVVINNREFGNSIILTLFCLEQCNKLRSHEH